MADEDKTSNLFVSDGAEIAYWVDERQKTTWRMDTMGYQLTELVVGSEVLYLARGGESRRLRESEQGTAYEAL